MAFGCFVVSLRIEMVTQQPMRFSIALNADRGISFGGELNYYERRTNVDNRGTDIICYLCGALDAEEYSVLSHFCKCKNHIEKAHCCEFCYVDSNILFA